MVRPCVPGHRCGFASSNLLALRVPRVGSQAARTQTEEMTSHQADRLHVGLEILSRAQDESHRHFLLRQSGAGPVTTFLWVSTGRQRKREAFPIPA